MASTIRFLHAFLCAIPAPSSASCPVPSSVPSPAPSSVPPSVLPMTFHIHCLLFKSNLITILNSSIKMLFKWQICDGTKDVVAERPDNPVLLSSGIPSKYLPNYIMQIDTCRKAIEMSGRYIYIIHMYRYISNICVSTSNYNYKNGNAARCYSFNEKKNIFL